MPLTLKKTNTRLPYPELRGTLKGIRYPAHCQVKLDGEFNYLIKERGKPAYLMNKHGLRRDGPIMITNDSITVIGELVSGDGKLGDLYKLLENKGAEKGRLNFSMFDILEVDGTPTMDWPLTRRMDMIRSLGFKTTLTGREVKSEEEVFEFFKEMVALGYEGIVVKNSDERLILGPNNWVKMKYKDQNDYFIKLIDPVLERIEVETLFVDKEVAVRKQCGVKVINKIKRTLKVGDLVTIEHQGILSGGGLRHPVFIKKA